MNIINKTINKKNKIELEEIYYEFCSVLNEGKGQHISLYSNVNIRKENPKVIDIKFVDYDEIEIYILFDKQEAIQKLGMQYLFENIDTLPDDLFHICGWEKDGGISCIY